MNNLMENSRFGKLSSPIDHHRIKVQGIIGFLIYNGVRSFEDIPVKECEELMLEFLQTSQGRKYFDGLRERMYDDLETIFDFELQASKEK